MKLNAFSSRRDVSRFVTRKYSRMALIPARTVVEPSLGDNSISDGKSSGEAMSQKYSQKLNLGCGPNAPANWLNVDGSWNAWLSNHTYLHKTLKVFGVISKNSPGAEWNVRPLVHDLTRPLPFKGNSVAVIYGAHVLEHLYLADAQNLLGECLRVLRPGGVIRMVVPDLRSMVTNYLKNKNGGSPSPAERIAAADKLNQMLGFRSPAPPTGNALFKFYYLWKDFHHHKWMYDSDSLIRYMENAGFVAVSEKAYLQSEIPSIEEVEEAGRVLDGAGICVEGRKP
jgi:SAM-dependent methyltransferase